MEHLLTSPPGVSPPKPIDTGVSILFNTGSKLAVNRILLRMRESAEDFLTMVDLNALTMEELNGNPQPDVGISQWDPRDISDFEGDDLSTLEGKDMEDLERIDDLDHTAYFGVVLQWEATRTVISALDSEGNGTTYTAPVLAANTLYLFRVDVEENSFRAKIFNTDANGNIGSLLYDTTTWIDDFLIVRRKGWLRWEEQLGDANADVVNIRTHSLVFAEYRSHPLKSISPVEGATLAAEFSPPIDRFTGVQPGPNGGTVEPDQSKALSEESFKVTNLGGVANQGIVSNFIDFQDFRNTLIEFDIFYPRAALDVNNDLELFIRNATGALIPLHFANPEPDQWHHVRLHPVQAVGYMPGSYQLFWRQAATGQATTWWIDNIRILEPSVIWEARATSGDPWNDSISKWMPFDTLINNEHSGVLFHQRGTELQVRGRALSRDANLGKVKIIPKYAELGRLVWDEQESNNDLAKFKSTTAATELSSTYSAAKAVDEDRTTRWSSSQDIVNLVTNPSFETDVAGWSANGFFHTNSAILNREASGGYAGVAHGRFVQATAGQLNWGIRFDLGVSIAAGTYTVSVRIKSPNSTSSVQVILARSDGNNSVIVGRTLTTSWQEVTVTKTITAGQGLQLWVRHTTSSATAQVDIDAAMVVAGSTAPTYFDGDSLGFKWTGTSHASTSVPDYDQWWQADLGSVKTISRIEIDWAEDYFASQYAIQTSLNGTTWDTVQRQNITRHGVQVTRFTPVDAQYVRIIRESTADTNPMISFSTVKIFGKLEIPTASWTSSSVGTTVTFDGSGSSDLDGHIISYQWTFGDGTQGFGKNIKHTYESSGVYTVTLTVVDNNGLIHTTSNLISI